MTIYLGCDCAGAIGWSEDHPSVEVAAERVGVCCRCRRVIAVDSEGRRAEREEESGPQPTDTAAH